MPSPIPAVTQPATSLKKPWAAPGPFTQRYLSAVAWSSAGSVLLQAGKIAGLVLAARSLGRHGFGQLGVLLSVFSALGALAGSGLGLTATHYVATYRENAPPRAAAVVSLTLQVAFAAGAVLALLTSSAASWAAENFLVTETLGPVLRFGAALIFLSALAGAQTGALAGLEAFPALARAQAAQGITFMVFVALGSAAGLFGAVAGVVTAALLGAAWQHAALHRAMRAAGLPWIWRAAWRERSVLGNYALPAFLTALITQPALLAAHLLLVRQPGGYEQMGWFTAANPWRTVVAFVPSLLAAPLLASLSRFQARHCWSAYRHLLAANIAAIAAVTVLLALSFAAAGPLILAIYGADFRGGETILAVLVAAAVFHATAGIAGQALASTSRLWAALALHIGWTIVLLSTAAVAVPRWGALGLAMALFAAYSVHLGATGALVYRTTHFIRGPGSAASPRPLSKALFSADGEYDAPAHPSRDTG